MASTELKGAWIIGRYNAKKDKQEIFIEGGAYTNQEDCANYISKNLNPNSNYRPLFLFIH